MGTMKFFMVALVCTGSFQACFAKTCIECEGKEGTDCAADTVDPTKVTTTCSLDGTINTTCVAYKYFKVEKGVPVEYIHRGCGPATECDTQNALSYTKLCYGCSDKDLCNDNFGSETESTICINCSGDDCKNDTVTLKDNTQFCKLNGEKTKACIAYKEQSGNDVKYTRSCAAEDQCTTLTKDNLLMCNKCTNDNCNLNVDTDTASTKCIECEGKEGTDCAADNVDTAKVSSTCSLDQTVLKTCLAYKYYKVEDGKPVEYTFRGCGTTDAYDTQKALPYTKIIAQCSDKDLCNDNFGTETESTICINCSGDDCKNDTVTLKDNTQFCKLDGEKTKACIAYKEQSGNDVKYTRSCAAEDQCTTLTKDNLLMCNKCTKDNCNINVDTDTAHNKCIKCEDNDETKCGADTTTVTDTCALDDTVNTECVVYKYLDADKATVTARGCAPANNCATLNTGTYKGSLSMCNECTGDKCNVKTDTDKAHNKCIKCEDKDAEKCAADSTTVTDTCSLDDTVNKECIVYKYLDKDNATMTARGCAPANNCATLNTGTYNDTLSLCNECTGDKCNVKTDTDTAHIKCIQCEGKSDSDCATNATKVTDTCLLDDTISTTCLAYKYFKVDNGKPVEYTFRGCGSEKDYETQKGLSYTKIINKCSNKDRCNSDFGKETENIICIACSGDDCKDDPLTLKDTKLFCKLDGTANKTCIAYKYQDKNKGNVTVRDCAPANNCATLNNGTYKGTLSMCNECTDDLCNVNTDTNSAHNKCIKCEDKAGSDCANNDIDTSKVNTTCSLDDTINLECVAYRYIKGENIMTYRGCAPENDCTSKNNKQSTKLCSECNTDNNCNAEIDASSEKTLCIKCDGDDCNKDDVVPTDDSQYCNILANNTCIAYKYLKKDANSTTYYRGCEEKDKGCEYLNKNDNFKLGTMQGCYECDGDDLCNRNINGPSTDKPVTTTAGVPSIVSFNIYLLPMIVATFIAYIV